MAEQHKVKKEDKLLNFLFETLNNWSKKKVKERLKSATVAVNGTITTKHDFPLNIGDLVEIGVIEKKLNSSEIKSLEILYQDDELIAINKPAGLLSVGNKQENKNHALAILRQQLTKGRKSPDLVPVHRLDRETSGILLFATSRELREATMGKWSEAEKIYLAVVNGKPREEKGSIEQPLHLDETQYKVHVGEHTKAKFALTHYKVKESKNSRSLVEVHIETGRQHQIRAHMSWLGNSVVGDERYGKDYKKGDRMGLHATKLTIFHPTKKKNITFEVDAPKEFYALLD
ncbi:MAG: tRNA pseudouridine synthase C (EC [uncultured Sulfurovum sp.]|uniref:Pseudouridine synthase n=1 Tax=uncultured Sulfurovum sp. TaxID=269237 RepID=A0A6S6SAL5_9BACT|nr:MAG: tRNA pseudouridine synthase C (EC [uncultured Sulfurovum sp.]